MAKNREIRKLISEVVDRIKEKYEPEKIILYGSYAYGKPTEDSDIDLFIVKDTDKRWVDRYVEVKRLIYDPERRISISPLVYTPQEVQERLALGDQFVGRYWRKGKCYMPENPNQQDIAKQWFTLGGSVMESDASP